MKKSILNLEGVQVLSRNEQKNVNGGLGRRCEYIGDEQILYSPGTTEGPNAGELVPVSITCSYSCKDTFLGIAVSSSYIVWGGCQ